MSSETDRFQDSVQAMEKTFQDLSQLLSKSRNNIRSGDLLQESNSFLSSDNNNDHTYEVAESHYHDDLKLDDLLPDSEELNPSLDIQLHRSKGSHLQSKPFISEDIKSQRVQDIRIGVKNASRNRPLTSSLIEIPLKNTSKNESTTEDDIREISNLLLDLQDPSEFLKDPESSKKHIQSIEKQAETLINLVKESGSKHEIDMVQEEQFLKELGEELGTTRIGKVSQNPSTPWEEVSLLRTQWLSESTKQKEKIQIPTLHKSTKDILLESRIALQSPSRYDALNTGMAEFVQEFTPVIGSFLPTRKALLVSVYNPKIPCREESLKAMYNICRILKFDEIMVLDTKNGTKKGVILHYYNELIKDAGEKDVRLFYIFGEAQLVFKEPLTFGFIDSTRNQSVFISRWDLETILYTSCIRIWDAVIDADFDENICEQSPPISHVSCEITSATPIPNLDRYGPSLFSNGLFEIIRWYAERRKKCTNRSLKYQLRLMLQEGEFKEGAIEFECFRQELEEEFTAPLRSAVVFKS